MVEPNDVEMMETITLIDEEGTEHEFEVEAFLEVDEEKYAVLIPIAEEFQDEAVIMRFGLDEAGEEVLYDIESDDEWEKVVDAYDEFAEEEFEDQELH